MRTSSRVFLFSILCFILMFFSACKKRRDLSQLSYMAELLNLPADSFAVVFSSSVEGYVQPCGCTSDPLGGIARFATVFHDVKTALKNRVAFIDAGNLLFDTLTRNPADLCQDERKIDLLVGTFKNLGLLSTLPGPFDNARGVEFRDQVYKKYHLNPLVRTFETISTGKYDIAVFGVTLDDKAQVLATRKRIDADIKAYKKNAKNVRVVIAKSQMPHALTKEVFSDLAGVDIVIQAQTSNMDPTPPVELSKNGPILIEGGRQGQYFTVLVLKNIAKRKEERMVIDNRAFLKNERLKLLSTRIAALETQAQTAEGPRLDFLKTRIKLAQDELLALKKGERIDELKNPNVFFHSIPLTKKVDPERSVDKQLEAYEKSIPALVRKCEEMVECKKAEPGTATYVGANSCKVCHEAAFTVWKNAISKSPGLDDDGNEIMRTMGHSRAWQTLVDVNKDADRSCIGCHSIGFMEKGGYCKAFEVDFRKDVQCESCHGPGSLHAQSGDKRFIKRKVSEETCRSCHHVPHIQTHDSFNYEERLTKILGPGHGEALLKELTHKLKTTTSPSPLTSGERD